MGIKFSLILPIAKVGNRPKSLVRDGLATVNGGKSGHLHAKAGRLTAQPF